ncbi:MAG: SGNH/GDSL hydrolase family protein [Acutalibacteraceae bacterium]|nr:SGNH/GDSL hydrolase family protein [Acutalibacteraceae bacterium]
MRKKSVISVLLILCTIATTGCTTDAMANTTAPNATEVATEKATKAKELCKVQIQSLDKQNLTDSVSYTIKSLTTNTETSLITDSLTTQNGSANIELESGEYVIQANSSDFEKQFIISDGETSKSISAENNSMYNILSNTNSVCFIGDSITIGSAVDGHGWYDGLIERFPNITTVDVAAKGGQTSASLFDNETDMNIIKESSAHTYVIALGINDVIYRNSNSRASSYTSAEYISNYEKLVRLINEKDTTAENDFIFIAPFEYINKYSYTLTKYIRRENTHEEYTVALYNWCKQNNYTFVAPMNYIKNTLSSVENASDYTVDDIHPSYPLGTKLYSEAVYESSVLNNTGTLKITQLFYNEADRNKTDTDYETYPTDYILTDVNSEIMQNTYFTIKNYSTGEYIDLKKSDTTGKYEYEKTSTEPRYYHPTSTDGSFTVDNIPEGGYIIKFEYNKKGYTSYLDTEIVFVNGGNTVTNSSIYMKNTAQ